MQTNDVAQCRRLITRSGSEQVHRFAFESAHRKGASSVTCVHKANIMKITDGLFLETFYRVAKEYPHILAKDLIVDDLAMKMVSIPDKFDYMVLPNLQGDIISDLCAGLIGGLGMAPSANIGDNICIFEAVHGSAPDIAGKGIANPAALLMSGSMMLRHLGFVEHGKGIQEAMVKALENGERTIDLCRHDPKATPLSTAQFATAIAKYLPASLTSPKVPVHWDKPENLHIPPKQPTKHVVHTNPKRDRSKEVSVGIDIFVDTHLGPPALADFVVKALGIQPSGSKTDKLTLTMLSNRGTQVYPTSSLFTECVNHYRVRIESPTGVVQNEASLMELAVQLTRAGCAVPNDNEKVRVCSMEMLLQVDGKKGYSLAQGQ
jgi:isocitrate dehydrogenase